MAGFALAALAGENETALTAIDRAIELNPNYALAYASRGLVLTWLNRPDEAIAAAERAIRLSPNDPIIFSSYIALCLAHLAAGRYQEALSWADRALGSNAGLTALRLKLSLCGHLGRREEASECLQRLRETYPEPTVAAVMRDVPKGYVARGRRPHRRRAAQGRPAGGMTPAESAKATRSASTTRRKRSSIACQSTISTRYGRSHASNASRSVAASSDVRRRPASIARSRWE